MSVITTTLSQSPVLGSILLFAILVVGAFLVYIPTYQFVNRNKTKGSNLLFVLDVLGAPLVYLGLTVGALFLAYLVIFFIKL